MMNKNVMRLVGLGGSALGFAASMLCDWAGSKAAEEQVREIVRDELSKQENENKEDEES